MNRLLGSAMATVLIASAITGIVLLANLQEPITQTTVEEKKWVRHPLGDGNPGAGNTGLMYFMAYPHQADPGTAYASNLSNATAYEFSDVGDAEMTGETPYNTAFDFVMKVRVNNTDGYNTSGSTWEDTWVRANLTVDFDFAGDISDSAMTEVVIGTEGTTYRWYHYYLNNAGSGYTITKGETYNCTHATLDIWE